MGFYDCIGRLLFMVIRKMVVCVECGKMLGFFEGHYHPTLGKKSLVCSLCLNKVQHSVDQWMKFILSNSFNTESSEPTFSVDWNSLSNRITGIKRRFTKTEEKKSSQSVQKRTSREVALNHLNCNNNNTLIQSERRTI